MKRYIGAAEERRKQRVRNAVRAQNKPRLSVFRSGRYIYAQIIDDARHCTVVSASSLEKELDLSSKSSCAAAQWVGRQVAKRAHGAGIQCVVFDRGAYKFHGRIKALAEGAREEGLSF